MSDAALDIQGAAQVSFCVKDKQTCLERVYYRDPLKVLFPRGEVPTATLVTTGGGLFGGDTYEIDIKLKSGTQALCTAQAAEKVYRSKGKDCSVSVLLSVDEGACLEWLPQETILFDRSRFRRQTTLDIAPQGVALAGEIIVFGRLASGEEVKSALLREAWDVRKDDQTVWTDALHMDGAIQETLNHPAGFGGARAVATAVYVSENAEAQLDTARQALGSHPGVKLGATCVNGVLLCRWLADEPATLRKAFGDFWIKFRHLALGRQDRLPRLWHC